MKGVSLTTTTIASESAEPGAAPRPDLCVFIGRFQPLHHGHLSVIRDALRQADHLVVLVGSANEARSVRNPFTAAERAEMIRACLAADDIERVSVLPLEDSNYNLNEWLESVQRTVHEAWQAIDANDQAGEHEPAVSLIGHSKDSSSYYLKLFPEWRAINVGCTEGLDATAIRSQLFGDLSLARGLLEGASSGSDSSFYLEGFFAAAREQAESFLAAQEAGTGPGGNMIPGPVATFLKHFLQTPGYRTVVDEAAHVARYRHQWRLAPYPPTFVTADALVVQSGHVLVVRRKNYPGRGLWALPGGFVDQGERIEDAMIRELIEETAIDVAEPALRARIAAREVFDNPYRSSRGRTITHAFLIHLEPGPQPRITASDDAEAAQWMPLANLERSRFFEDHYAIIRNLVARL
jgi:bifunctional NMN adenylyltransferase/nudix hydrolase